MIESTREERINERISRMKSAPPRSCNRHVDCNKADIAAMEKGATFGTDHCHDDECEDCFGC